MNTEVTFGDQLEIGLSDDQLITNAKTWRHIWFVQRFVLRASDQFLRRATMAYSQLTAEKAPTLIGLLQEIATRHDSAHSDVHYEMLKQNVGDPQLSKLIDNTRMWLDTQYPTTPATLAIVESLHQRCLTHDQSKLVAPEVQTFTEMTAKLATAEYGSDEYKGFLVQMKPALDNHYGENRHHPEHFEDGLEAMNLIDVLEMYCDWVASSLRTKGGDILKSFEIQKDRFKMSDELVATMKRTHEQFFTGEYRKNPAEFYSQKLA